jgi:hypothetical protein
VSWCITKVPTSGGLWVLQYRNYPTMRQASAKPMKPMLAWLSGCADSESGFGPMFATGGRTEGSKTTEIQVQSYCFQFRLIQSPPVSGPRSLGGKYNPALGKERFRSHQAARSGRGQPVGWEMAWAVSGAIWGASVCGFPASTWKATSIFHCLPPACVENP